MKIIGIDLAWQSERNTTALAVGELHDGCLHITKIHDSLASLNDVMDVIDSQGTIIARHVYYVAGMMRVPVTSR